MTAKRKKYEHFQVGDTVYRTTLNKMHKNRKPYVVPDTRKLDAFIPGTILDIAFKDGDEVKEGDVIMYLEAMKMKNIIKAPFDGIIKTIHVKEGDLVSKNQLLVELE
ncbi:MAG: acetyl-CoA carboxylase biotin carboxyl carrier protein subunit [Bacteroidetes bacterium]|nr:MAG: acetyl-CoA carboxylase biotin carboxyl carrier protein subunit [Bacteroidota bacterium]